MEAHARALKRDKLNLRLEGQPALASVANYFSSIPRIRNWSITLFRKFPRVITMELVVT